MIMSRYQYNLNYIQSKRRVMNGSNENINKESIYKSILQHFPREPYPIQIDIANLLYQALQKQRTKLAIIQSPTGTGKTYSLLVPLIVWLKKNRTKIKSGEETQKKPSLPSWLKKPSQQKVEKIFSERKKRIQGAVSIAQAQKQLMKLRVKHVNTPKQAQKSKQQQEIQVQSEDQGNRHGFKRRLQSKIDMLVEKQLKIQDQNVLPKIIFISRTHSQLAQVIQSIKLITENPDQIKYLQVASKQHLCINPAVNNNKSNISQRCQYILDHSKCQFFHNLAIKQFFNTNIEDANQLGDAHHLCPYYATRNLIEQCDIVCLPYASILSSDVRNRIGINIHNSIVVFDEGHNVIDNEKQLHSPQIVMEDVALLAQQIDEYSKKFQERLKISNYKLLIHFLEILRALITAMERYREERKKQVQQKKYIKVGYLQFISQMSIKQLNIFKLVKYIQLNNIDQKLAYFNANEVGKSKNKKEIIEQSRITVGKINNILRFFMQFALFDEQKQILLLKWSQSKKGCLKILCLQSEELQKIINKSRLTIVAGGTMQPLDDFSGLFEKFRQKVIVKKYPHIIKKQQCKVVILKKIGNKQIIFNHQTTNDQKQLQDLKKSCLKVLTKIIKKTEKGGGIVVFIQNYRLIQFFKDAFKDQQLYSRMLFDSKEPQQNVKKDTFQTYKKQVETDSTNNHILFSVMGGKLSQGINFSDRLARSLIVFGLPYANIYAPQIIQTINHLQNHKKSTKKQYLQSLCLRTLNQTIGRGVRHINDYVDIYLVDARFDGIKHKLSEWMKDRVTVVNDIEQL